jgi:hypothetical protein
VLRVWGGLLCFLCEYINEGSQTPIDECIHARVNIDAPFTGNAIFIPTKGTQLILHSFLLTCQDTLSGVRTITKATSVADYFAMKLAGRHVSVEHRFESVLLF